MNRLKSFTIMWVLVVVGALGAFFISAIVVIAGVNRTLDQHAIGVATDWAQHLTRELPEIERLVEGEIPRPEQRHVIDSARLLGGVYRWKIFDTDGELTIDSAYLDLLAAGGSLPREAAEEEEQDVAEHGWPHAYVTSGDGVENPLRYAKAGVELVADGRRIGFVEVYVDQTETARVLRQTFANSAIEIAALTGLAFLLPGLGFLWRTKQQLATSNALAHAAAHDALTGLLNRNSFRDAVDRQIAAAGAGQAFRVLFLDLDRFKYVNDSKGHPAGDELLRQVAARLAGVAVPGVRACRLGGDEFALLEPPQDAGEAHSDLAERLIEALSRPFQLDGDQVSIGASIGISTYPRDARGTSDLLKAADLALYEVKTRGRGHFREYAPEMEVRRDRRIAVEHRLRQAVEFLDFQLDYQPLYRRETGMLAGFEALMRLSDIEGGPLSPAEFIPIAEETELIIPLGKAILARACREAATWPGELSVAVNLSTVQFSDGTLTDAVRRALDESGIAPQRLELEVTETVLMSDPDAVAMQLDSLKELGVSIALDDFGTGYSSLSYLWRFPFDKLKIDGSFMASLEDGDERSMQVLRTIVALGEVLKLEVTAEGIETRGQAREIGQLNVDFVQGYLYGRPVPASGLSDVISGRAKAELSPQPEAYRPEPVRRSG